MSALGRVKTAPYLCGRAIDFTAWGCRILLSGCCWTEVGGLHIPASIRWAYFAVQTRSNRVRPGVAGASDRRVTQTMHQATSTANLLTAVSFCVRTSFFYVRTSFFTYVRTYLRTHTYAIFFCFWSLLTYLRTWYQGHIVVGKAASTYDSYQV